MRRLLPIVLLLAACAAPPADDAPQLGERVPVPMGYVFHCIDYPDSVFCSDDD